MFEFSWFDPVLDREYTRFFHDRKQAELFRTTKHIPMGQVTYMGF